MTTKRKSDHHTTKDVVLNQPLPLGTETYTVIPNKFIIDLIEKEFKKHNFIVTSESYAAYNNNDVAIGRYVIQHDGDEDLSMLFYFTNSYDKTSRFRCGIGALVNANDALIIGDSAHYTRIHKGTAKDDAEACIIAQLKASGQAYEDLYKHKKAMEATSFSDNQFYELIGELYLKNKISPYQLSIIKNEYETPSYQYNTTDNNMWTLYNHIQVGLKRSHSKSVFNNSQLVHYYVCNKHKILTHPIVLGIETPQTQEGEEELYVNPNQITLEQAITAATQTSTDEIDLQDLQDVQDELDQSIEETIGESISETESIVREMLDDDMSSYPEATEEEANELLHGVDNTGGLENEEEDVFNALADLVKPEDETPPTMEETYDLVEEQQAEEEESSEDSGLTSFLDESESDSSDQDTLAESGEKEVEETIEEKIASVLEHQYYIDSEGFSFEEAGDEYIVTTNEGDKLVFDKEDFE